MAENPNLVQEFEEAFQKSLSALTEEDDLMTRDPQHTQHIIEDKIATFTDLARQLETFFLQKRFLIYNYKPEMVLKEDTAELKQELVRKDELIRKHYEKLIQWQNMLADVQGVQPASATVRPQGAPGLSQLGPPGGMGLPQPGMPGGPLGSFGPSGSFSRMPGPGSQMYGGPNLQGPLAYLERTTSAIGGPMGPVNPMGPGIGPMGGAMGGPQGMGNMGNLR